MGTLHLCLWSLCHVTYSDMKFSRTMGHYVHRHIVKVNVNHDAVLMKRVSRSLVHCKCLDNVARNKHGIDCGERTSILYLVKSMLPDHI